MSITNNSDNNGNNQSVNKKRAITPTIGDAVKEALETDKKVIMEGPTDVGGIADIQNSISNVNGLDKIDKEIDKGIVLSVDETNNSKIELNVKDTSVKTSLIEDKIIINKESAEDATVATVTTITAEEGVEVEVRNFSRSTGRRQRQGCRL